MGKNPSYPSQKGHKKSSSNSSSSGKRNYSRIGSVKSNTTTYANNSSVQNFGSRVDDCIRSNHSRMQNSTTLSYLSRIENDMRSTGLAYSRLSTFSSRVDSDIRSSHSSNAYSRISNSYPSYESMVDNDTSSVVSSVSGSSLRTAPSWSYRLDSDIRTNASRISSSYGYY
ncbi:hypothetical protein PHAVU_003G053500 [Phaseolus vulgaris]|uniref:Uncharacterized protein n=1 Tax=Phaseolus vulgaris TaxID=3885 RepID=V7C9T5_PHAVU|nr:hypothetical protein PHAVU_003G053500g [Phaseolus vulgaris]ESW25646.1 hypothetical protein PHAVU_003G053500g [Phaseolus vulgaris]